MLTRRIAGEPLEQILGWAEFRGLRIALEPGVFVPRFRTGYLVELALEFAREGGTVLDLCCGAGAIGAAIAAELPGIEVYAADLDPAAVTAARRNLQPDRVFAGDLFAALPPGLLGRIDLIVVNAPYVPTDAIATMPAEARIHEHRLALDGGRDGLDMHRRIAESAAEWMSRPSALIIETSETQAPTTAEIFACRGFATEVAHSADYDGTVVVATL
jgi:release factor glutamine methyltransferase